jgi:hypothetical protein
MADTYTKAVLTVIALALALLAVRPVVTPPRVDAQDSTLGQIVERLNRLEHNSEVLRSAANTNAHQTNVRFAKQGSGIDVVLVDTDVAGVMGPRSEPAVHIPEVPNPF